MGKLAREVGLLTNNVLRHVVFWFEGHDIDETALWTSSRLWSDLLGAGPFATRPSRNGGSLMHADRSPDEAARLFIQALFDQIQAGYQNDWTDKATKEMVTLLRFHCLPMLNGEGLSIPTQTLPGREIACGKPSTDLLSGPVSDSRLAKGPRSRQDLRRLPVPRGHGTPYNDTPRIRKRRREVRAGASINDSDMEQEETPRIRKRRRHADLSIWKSVGWLPLT